MEKAKISGMQPLRNVKRQQDSSSQMFHAAHRVYWNTFSNFHAGKSTQEHPTSAKRSTDFVNTIYCASLTKKKLWLTATVVIDRKISTFIPTWSKVQDLDGILLGLIFKPLPFSVKLHYSPLNNWWTSNGRPTMVSLKVWALLFAPLCIGA